VYKVPDPERRQDIVEQKRWAVVWLKRSEARQLGPEIVKMRTLIQRCDTELEEMRLIEAYQKDEQYEPHLHIDTEV
jgi:hypothetical protein